MSTDDLRQIEELHRRDRAASLSGDLEGLVLLMDEDIVLLLPGGPPTRGRAAVAASLEAQRDKSPEDKIQEYVHEFEEVKVLGEWAFEWGSYRGTTLKPDGTKVKETGHLMRLLRRQPEGGWKVARAIAAADPPVVEENSG